MNSFKEQRRETLYNLLPGDQALGEAEFSKRFEQLSAFVEQEVAAAFKRGLRAGQRDKFPRQKREVRSAVGNGKLNPVSPQEEA